MDDRTDVIISCEDLKHLDDSAIVAILRRLTRKQIHLALKSCSNEVQDLLFRNMNRRAEKMFRNCLQVAPAPDREDVDAAQQEVVDLVQRLQADGTIVGGVSTEKREKTQKQQ